MFVQFQKIYVIDLPKRFDHRDGLSLAASMTGLQLEYVDGVSGLEKGYLPEDYWKTSLDDGALYCWRAHVNVARLMVEQNIASALILEGDQDWDIRIKEQMYLYSEAARQYISQPEEKFRRHVDFAPNTVPGAVDAPYGKIDDWDMHWIGHCGMDWAPDDSDIPSGRVVIQNDDTIPESQHIDFGFGRHDLAEEYANHTRVVAHAKGGICMGAYALSLPGARNWLFRLGIESLFSAIDVMAQGFCDGWGGRPINKCLSSVPPLFSSHRPAGNASAHSDIGHHQGHVDKAYSKNVRWSTRLNLGKLVEGRTDYIDSYKDQTPQP
ncbi:hypothetical protein PRZ48_006858 [Zasmidium cellare]|uniref:Glycosyltransferase family 25 protein n=1 Tax=Zasmidium cellare TaxID=395010 RepID=A0ABR0EHR8_ZASCE|nr:hypothetical protein PRZ48_006858 [Zasmidium cellare]